MLELLSYFIILLKIASNLHEKELVSFLSFTHTVISIYSSLVHIYTSTQMVRIDLEKLIHLIWNNFKHCKKKTETGACHWLPQGEELTDLCSICQLNLNFELKIYPSRDMHSHVSLFNKVMHLLILVCTFVCIISFLYYLSSWAYLPKM